MAQNPWDMKWEVAPAPKAGSQAASSAAPWEMNWEAQKSVTAKAPNAPSMSESDERGLVQGVTLGYGDELKGAGEVLTSPRSWAASVGLGDGPSIRDVYIKRRDEDRRANQAAQMANPGTYTSSTVAGAVVPVAVGSFFSGGTAAPVLTTLATGAALGAAGGAGYSDAENVPDVALDAAKGAALGAATAGAGRALATPAGKQAAKDATSGALSVGKWIMTKLANGTTSVARSAWNTAKYGAIAYGADQATDGGIRNYLFGQAGIPSNSGSNK